MDSETLVRILTIFLAVMFLVLFVLIGVYYVIKIKNKNKEKEELQEKKDATGDRDVKKPEKEYTKESIFDFMEFEKIEDNMIIQKKGKFLMVIECQGINYDLMSEMEKVSVEQGFLQFLNTLRYPIQFFVQTRTVNLEKSIRKYKDKLKIIEDNYNEVRTRYQTMQRKGGFSKEEEQNTYYNMVKQRNLYEYTRDIITNIEKTSLNSNVLNKRYYIIVPYYKDAIETENYSKEEIQNMVFSELYTRCRSIINALFSCQVSGKILNSLELIEMLYTSFNRDEADVFDAERALNGGFEDLFSTSTDVLDKKMKALDNEIQRKAIEYANDKIEETQKEKEIRKKKENLNNLVMDLAKGMIEHDKLIIGEDLANETIENIEKEQNEGKDSKKNSKQKEEGGMKDESIKEKGKRGRPRRITA